MSGLIKFISPSVSEDEAEFMVDLGDFPGTISVGIVGADSEASVNVPVAAVRELIGTLNELLPRAEAGETGTQE